MKKFKFSVSMIAIASCVISPLTVLAQENPTPTKEEPKSQESIQVNSNDGKAIGRLPFQHQADYEYYDNEYYESCPYCGRGNVEENQEQVIEAEESQYGSYVSPL